MAKVYDSLKDGYSMDRLSKLAGTPKKKKLDESFVELDAYVPTTEAGKFIADLRETLANIEDDCHVCDEDEDDEDDLKRKDERYNAVEKIDEEIAQLQQMKKRLVNKH